MNRAVSRLFRLCTLLALSIAPLRLGAQTPSCTDLCKPPALLSAAERSALVLTDPAILGAPEFRIGHVLGRILETAGRPQAGADLADEARLLRTMLDTMKESQFRLKESSLTVAVPVRNEAQLDAAALLTSGNPDELVAVALFNRIDQIPESAVHCGEHRIVYGMRSGSSNQLRRFFLIFEAAIRNPEPGNRDACRPLARHWREIGRATGEERMALLRALYFTGVDGDGDDFPDFMPAIHYAHFGEPYGQVRSNMFVAQPWQLREWRVEKGTDLRFIADTAKNSPHGALWQDTGAGALSNEQWRFRRALITDVAEKLFAPELAAAAEPACVLSDHERLMGFATNIPPRFNGAKSDANFPDGALPEDSPNTAGTIAKALLTGVAQSVNTLRPVRPLTQAHATNRIEAMTCGGCHMTSVGKEVAGGTPRLAWPAALTFTHVSEAGALSPALSNVFLPARFCAMQRMLDGAPVAGVASLGDVSVASPEAAASIDALARVRQLRTSLEGPGVGPAAVDGPTAAALRAAIETARDLEREERGAIVPVRRTHG